VAGFAARVGFDRDRSFAPTILIVVASYYVLFALNGASTRAVVVESVIATVFLLIAVIGFKTSAWITAAAMVGHGVFDFIHDFFIHNPGMPTWWPGFCLPFDAVFGLWLLAMALRRSHLSLTRTAIPHPDDPDAHS
jgi:hypothetical protein